MTTDRTRIISTIENGDSDRLARIALAVAARPVGAVAAFTATNGPVAAVERILTFPPPRRDDPPAMEMLDAAVRLSPEAFYAALHATDEHGYRVVIPSDLDWPPELDDLGDAQPVALWATGEARLLRSTTKVTVTGARAATPYGLHVAEDIAMGLADHEVTVVSRLGYGIDASAHRSAMVRAQPTIGVAACGLDVGHPQPIGALIDQIARRGVIISEYPPGTRPARMQFFHAARLTAALSAATVIVELADHRSATTEVACQAINLDRRVGAVPGPVTSSLSNGCHRLIQTSKTRLVMSADDVLEMLQT